MLKIKTEHTHHGRVRTKVHCHNPTTRVIGFPRDKTGDSFLIVEMTSRTVIDAGVGDIKGYFTIEEAKQLREKLTEAIKIAEG